jgi:hypothetical protein
VLSSVISADARTTLPSEEAGAGAQVERIRLAACEPVRRADELQARDRGRPADRDGVALDARAIAGGEPAVAHVGDHRRHRGAAAEPLVDQPLRLG